jgi:hypothetical protein
VSAPSGSTAVGLAGGSGSDIFLQSYSLRRGLPKGVGSGCGEKGRGLERLSRSMMVVLALRVSARYPSQSCPMSQHIHAQPNLPGSGSSKLIICS